MLAEHKGHRTKIPDGNRRMLRTLQGTDIHGKVNVALLILMGSAGCAATPSLLQFRL